MPEHIASVRHYLRLPHSDAGQLLESSFDESTSHRMISDDHLRLKLPPPATHWISTKTTARPLGWFEALAWASSLSRNWVMPLRAGPAELNASASQTLLKFPVSYADASTHYDLSGSTLVKSAWSDVGISRLTEPHSEMTLDVFRAHAATIACFWQVNVVSATTITGHPLNEPTRIQFMVVSVS